MKIYTRTGDRGETGLFGGGRVRKDDLRVEAYGTVDELNAILGLCREALGEGELCATLQKVQSDLFVVGAELACAAGSEDKLNMALIGKVEAEELEQLMDRLEDSLPPLKTFVLPGGSRAGALLHHARTVARRAERRCVTLGEVRSELIVYLNRLSDALFVLARTANRENDVSETPWLGRTSKSES